MEYSEMQFHSPPPDSTSVETLRPRLNTWPAQNIFNNDNEPQISEEPKVFQNHSESSPIERKEIEVVKRSKSKSPNGKVQQRRKLTTHKLSAKSYVDLITEAIMSTPEHRMTLADIYKWMIINVPCFNQQANVSASSGWKNAVRHTLSLHKRFKRVQRGRLQKPAWWTIHDIECGGESISAMVQPNNVTLDRRHSDGSVVRPHYQFSTGLDSSPAHLGNVHGVFQSAQPLSNLYVKTEPHGILGQVESDGNWWETQGYAGQQLPLTNLSGDSGYVGDDTMEGQMSTGGHNALTRSLSDTSSYDSSPYYLHTLAQSYSPNQYTEAYLASLRMYESKTADTFSNLYSTNQITHDPEVQSVLVKTETGELAQINVPMPVRMDFQHQSTHQAQTGLTASDTQHDFTNSALLPQHHFGPRPVYGETALPQDLLHVQLDHQVQCNVAEVLAYEMGASTDTTEMHNNVHEFYDMIKAA